MKKSIYKTPSKGTLFKDLNKSNAVLWLKNLVTNPFGQFICFGILMMVIGLLAQNEILPISLTTPIASILIYSIVSIGFCLLLGYSGLASLGTAGFAGIGAYSAFYIMQGLGLSFITALIVSISIALVLGLFVGFISLRIEGMYLAILTLGLSEILIQIFKTLESSIRISQSKITFLIFQMDKTFLFILITIILVVLLCLTNNLINSPTGRAMLAMKNSTSAAQAMGISLIKFRLLAFIISTIYAAIGGLLYILLVKSETPSDSQFFALSFSLNILGAVIVGGSKSLWGAIFGVFIIFGIQPIILNRIDFFVENSWLIPFVTGILLIVIVMFFPGGLTQLFYEVKGKIQKFISKRRAKKYGTH